MTFANDSFVNFEFGEIAPIADARFDLKIGVNGLKRCQNFIVEPTGPVRYRNGFKFVHYTRRMNAARFIPFQFNDQQAYLVEVTDTKMRFYKDEAIIVEASKAITGITKANPAVVTSASHGYSNGDEVFINNVAGMTEVNGKSYIVANVATNTFELTDVFGTNVNSSAYTTYTSGGIAERIYEITTPYAAADVEDLQFTQNADTMYITHQTYPPRKLTRSGHTSWTLATYTRTTDPFGSATNYPRSCAFTSDARLLMGGTITAPETIWGSRSPNASGPRYDDFTTGTAADDSVKFTLAPVKGQVDSVRWLSNTDKFIVCGTYGTVRRIFGASEQEPITPSSISAKPINSTGCQLTLPQTVGSAVFYIERGGKRLQSFEYNYQQDGYIAVDRNLIAPHLSQPGLKQIVFQNGNPNIAWACRDDGVLLGFTFESKEDKAAWHRHIIGGSGTVEWVGRMARDSNVEQLWVIVKRTINGHTVRTVEFMEDAVVFPEMEDFITPNGSPEEQARDIELFENALFEAVKYSVHLDSCVTYDGSDYGSDAGASLTLSDDTGTITITASAAVFTSSMVGREIWPAYDTEGHGGGRIEITGYTSSTVVTGLVLAEPEYLTAAAGEWFLTTTSVTGLHHLEGETVSISADAIVPSDAVVTNGALTLDNPASVVHVGFSYTGFGKSMNIEMGGSGGPAQTKPRNLAKAEIRFMNTSGPEFGVDPYRLGEIEILKISDVTDRPVPPYTGVKEIQIPDKWERQKYFYFYQRKPLPCIIKGIDLYGETTDE